jgi:hypothetical protein
MKWKFYCVIAATFVAVSQSALRHIYFEATGAFMQILPPVFKCISLSNGKFSIYFMTRRIGTADSLTSNIILRTTWTF